MRCHFILLVVVIFCITLSMSRLIDSSKTEKSKLKLVYWKVFTMALIAVAVVFVLAAVSFIS